MKKKAKIKLSEIKVESFITSIEGFRIEGRGTGADYACQFTNNGCGGNQTVSPTSPYPCSPCIPGNGASGYTFCQSTCNSVNTCANTCYMYQTCGGQGTCSCGVNQTAGSGNATCSGSQTCAYC